MWGEGGKKEKMIMLNENNAGMERKRAPSFASQGRLLGTRLQIFMGLP